MGPEQRRGVKETSHVLPRLERTSEQDVIPSPETVASNHLVDDFRALNTEVGRRSQRNRGNALGPHAESLDHVDADRLTVRDDVVRRGYRSWERPSHQPRAHSRMPFGMREDGQVVHSNEPGRPTVV